MRFRPQGSNKDSCDAGAGYAGDLPGCKQRLRMAVRGKSIACPAEIQ